MNLMLEIIAQFEHVPTCIVCDFNEDVSITSNMHCCTMFRSQGYQQMVNKPTHDIGTIIDHLIKPLILLVLCISSFSMYRTIKYFCC